MDPGNLSPEQMEQLRSIARFLQPLASQMSSGMAATPVDQANRDVGPIPAYQPHQGHPSTTVTTTSGPSLPGSSQGHPSTMLTATATPDQPFLGFNGLGVSMAGHVNRQRLSAAAAHLPRQPRLAVRGRRRGPAIHPPSMPRTPQIDDCLSTVSVSGADVPGIRVKVRVYPPPELPSATLVVYRFLRDSFDAVLQSWHLTYSYDLPQSTTIADLIFRVVADMQSSPYAYEFTNNPSTCLLVHEALPLQLLEFVNRGTPRADGQVRLRRAAHSQMSIANLVQSRARFAVPNYAIEENRFIIHFVVRLYPLIATAVLSAADTVPRPHTCVSRRIYNVFGLDGTMQVNENDGGDTSDEDSSVPSRHATVEPTPTQPCGSSTNHVESSTHLSESSTRAPQRDHSLSAFSFLPPRIWDTVWAPTGVQHMGELTTVFLAENVYELASQGASTPELVISADDVTGLVVAFKEVIGEAVDTGDFTRVLSPERSFTILSRGTHGRSRVRSIGEGIEREVIHTLFEEFRAKSTEWFMPRADGYSTLATTHNMSTARYIPSSRLRNLAILGATTALCLIHGMSTTPWDPVFLHFLVHNCDFASIHAAFLEEWHPVLKQIILEWVEVGPSGDITRFQDHFASYHDQQVACLRDRTEDSHAALAAEMLYRSVIGTEPPNHPEIQAFRKGLQLQCRNGSSFLMCVVEILKSWNGGSEQFFRLVWSTRISSFETLVPHLRIVCPPPALQMRLDTARGNFNFAEPLTFSSLLTQFLQGSGIPNPVAFTDARTHFNPIINLGRIEESNFRVRMFCWATTGSCERAADAAPISVEFVEDNDPSYGTSAIRTAMIDEGKINFKTCFSKVLIPASYIIRLAIQNSSLDSHIFQRAVDHWLLCEVLNAIGNHTVA